MVEFALVLPIFLMILMAFIDVGRLVYMDSVLSQAAREAARVASVEASWLPPNNTDASCNTSGGPTCPANYSALQADVVAAANRMVAPFAVIPSTSVYTQCNNTVPPTGTWTTQTCTNHANGDLTSVRVVMSWSPITPIIGNIIGPRTLAGAATMNIN